METPIEVCSSAGISSACPPVRSSSCRATPRQRCKAQGEPTVLLPQDPGAGVPQRAHLAHQRKVPAACGGEIKHFRPLVFVHAQFRSSELVWQPHTTSNHASPPHSVRHHPAKSRAPRTRTLQPGVPELKASKPHVAGTLNDWGGLSEQEHVHALAVSCPQLLDGSDDGAILALPDER